jgi:serine/threonine protein kinase
VGKNIGSGSHGTVFRVVHKDRPEAGSYALKVARKPNDERFEREAWLLSRIRHPSVPRLEDSGTWKGPDGEDYPYVVMQWVEGLGLYAWALEHGLTLRQAIRLLARVARALQATHQHGVHRDVKGGNIRVSDEGHAVLLDFGSCWYPQAGPLTDGHELPGAGRYRSPQQLFFRYVVLEYGWQGHYEPQPADDLYSLGVTAYRLLAGDYPPNQLGAVDGSQKVVRLKAPRGLKEACPELAELIERLLSDIAEERGSAEAVAEELEALLEYSRPALDEPWKVAASRQSTKQAAPPAPPEPMPPLVPRRQTPRPVARKPKPPPVPREHEGRQPAPQSGPAAPREPTPRQVPTAPKEPAPRQAPAAPRESPPQLGAAGVLIMLVLLGVLLTRNVDRSEGASTEAGCTRQATGSPDAGPSGLGEEALTSVKPAEPHPASEEKITREVPAEPLPDQRLPPCSRWGAVEINGGCWRPQVSGADTAPCYSDLYEYEGRCYAPVLISGKRVPTSKDPQ